MLCLSPICEKDVALHLPYKCEKACDNSKNNQCILVHRRSGCQGMLQDIRAKDMHFGGSLTWLHCHWTGGNGWAIKSNYPALNSGRVFRLDWFVVFYQLVLSFLVVIATVSRVLPQVLSLYYRTLPIQFPSVLVRVRV